MHSAKQGIAQLAEVCVKMGLRHVVFSPGSRNAPLVIEFANREEIECKVITDERCAAFFALGMAQQLQQPVAICSTSGSAALNYAPAIAEAYYQRIPLVVLTADRPPELVDHADGQTIRQENVYHNYIKASFQLSTDATHPEDLQIVQSALTEAITHHAGPVHINIPLNEPLYGMADTQILQEIELISPGAIEPKELRPSRVTEWQASTKKLILVGQHYPNDKLTYLLEQLATDPSVAVVTENTSNVPGSKFNGCIDRLISSFTPEETPDYVPEILVTIGENIVSKKIKALFREHPPTHHWNIDPTPEHPDTYMALTHEITGQSTDFLRQLHDLTKPVSSKFANKWKQRDLETQDKHQKFLQTAPYSDLTVFEHLLDRIPSGSDLQLANSTAIRYAQLFNPLSDVRYFSNRGVSGIDGSTSTAAGAASITGKPTTLITGDLAFFYDSNALWDPHLPTNLRVIVINNQGGGIFRFIPGPTNTPQLETFFEAHHNYRAEQLCKAFDVPYYQATSLNEIEQIIPEFYAKQNNDRPAVLEILTPREVNDKVLRDYFKNIAS